MAEPGRETGLDLLRNRLRASADVVAIPLARVLQSLHVTPNQLTVFGFLVNLVAAGLILHGDLFWAGVIYLFAGGFDLMDGTLARLGGRASKFGAFIDSTLDRVSEGVVFAAIAYHFAIGGQGVAVALVVLALLGSVLVSYVRARAEGLGGRCTVGLVTRPERVVLLAVGLLSGFLAEVIALLVALTGITVVQRVCHVARQFAPESDEPPSAGMP